VELGRGAEERGVLARLGEQTSTRAGIWLGCKLGGLSGGGLVRGRIVVVAVIKAVGLDRVEGKALFDEVSDRSGVCAETGFARAARIAVPTSVGINK
jgi:hypothetical protein